MAQRLVADGFAVLLADVQRDPLAGGEPTDELIKRAGGSAEFVRADVSLHEDCERLVALAVERHGGLHVLVNNAAIAGAHSKPLLQTAEEDWDKVMAVNLRGPYMLSQAAIRQMLTQPLRGDSRGRIVNITSQYGMVASPGNFAYAVLPVPYRTTPEQPTMQSLRDPITVVRPFPTALDPFTCTRYEHADFARAAHALGVRYIGVCCGAGPHYIRSVAEALGRTPPASRYPPDMSKHAFLGTEPTLKHENQEYAERL